MPVLGLVARAIHSQQTQGPSSVAANITKDDLVRFKMAIPPKWYQFLVGLFASLGSFNFGYDLGIIAQVVASDSFVSKFNPTDNEK